MQPTAVASDNRSMSSVFERYLPGVWVMLWILAAALLHMGCCPPNDRIRKIDKPIASVQDGWALAEEMLATMGSDGGLTYVLVDASVNSGQVFVAQLAYRIRGRSPTGKDWWVTIDNAALTCSVEDMEATITVE